MCVSSCVQGYIMMALRDINVAIGKISYIKYEFSEIEHTRELMKGFNILCCLFISQCPFCTVLFFFLNVKNEEQFKEFETKGKNV